MPCKKILPVFIAQLVVVPIGLYTWAYILCNPSSFFDKDHEPVYIKKSAEFYMASMVTGAWYGNINSNTNTNTNTNWIINWIINEIINWITWVLMWLFGLYCILTDQCRQLVPVTIMEIPTLISTITKMFPRTMIGFYDRVWPTMFLFSRFIAPTVLLVRALHYDYIRWPPENGVLWFAYMLSQAWNAEHYTTARLQK
jgi:hypothetical protein